MLDLLVIHPGAAHGIYGELGDTLVAVEPPQWVRIIAAYAKDRGFKVDVVDAEAHRWSPEIVAQRVRSLKPGLICIAVYGHQPSASTQQMVGASATVKEIKKLGIDTPILMMGGHVAALPQRTLVEEGVDYVCTGEGPITVVRLLEGWRPLDVPGLMFNHNGKVARTDPAPLIEDMNELHGSVWSMLPMELYRAHNWQCFGDLGKRQPYVSIFTSLGCPYKCSFCCINAPFASHRYRMRSPMAVVSEIQYLFNAFGVATFKITDEMFVLNERHYTSICNGLIKAGLGDKINIWAYARVDTVKPDTLKLLRSAGIRWLALGIESSSKYVRDGAQKRLKNDDITGVVRAIQAADINVIGNYIFGLPDDDHASMASTLDLALELKTEFANFYSAMAYPGSPLYTEAVAKGWQLPGSWRGFSQHNDDCRPLDTQHVGAAEVLKYRDYAFNRYFSDTDYLQMVRNKFGTDTFNHVQTMTSYKLKRKLLEAA